MTTAKNKPKTFVPGKDPDAGLKPAEVPAETKKLTDKLQSAQDAYTQAIDNLKDEAVAKAEAEGPARDKEAEARGVEPRKVVHYQDMFPPNHMADNTKDPTKNAPKAASKK